MFNSRKQQEGESIQHFVSALQQLSESCEFGDIWNRLIHDRLVISVRSDQTSHKRLLGTGSLDLPKAIDDVIDEDEERTKLLRTPTRRGRPGRSRSTPSSTAANATPEKETTRTRVQKLRTYPPAVKCPAYGVKCHSCGKLNHFTRVCQRKSAQKMVVHAVELEVDQQPQSVESADPYHEVFTVWQSVGSLLGQQQ